MPRMPMKQKEPNIPVKEDEKPTRKKAYEKPRLETVMLFADQVLGTCKTAPPCVILNPGSS